MRKILEFAEIRARLQDAVVELVKLRQSVPKSPPEPLVLRSGERWLVLEVLPEVDLSSRPRVLEFVETWVREARCLGSGQRQFEQGSVVQQQSSYQRLEGNEQQVLVQVSARSTADRRSISL